MLGQPAFRKECEHKFATNDFVHWSRGNYMIRNRKNFGGFVWIKAKCQFVRFDSNSSEHFPFISFAVAHNANNNNPETEMKFHKLICSQNKTNWPQNNYNVRNTLQCDTPPYRPACGRIHRVLECDGVSWHCGRQHNFAAFSIHLTNFIIYHFATMQWPRHKHRIPFSTLNLTNDRKCSFNTETSVNPSSLRIVSPEIFFPFAICRLLCISDSLRDEHLSKTATFSWLGRCESWRFFGLHPNRK